MIKDDNLKKILIPIFLILFIILGNVSHSSNMFLFHELSFWGFLATIIFTLFTTKKKWHAVLILCISIISLIFNLAGISFVTYIYPWSASMNHYACIGTLISTAVFSLLVLIELIKSFDNIYGIKSFNKDVLKMSVSNPYFYIPAIIIVCIMSFFATPTSGFYSVEFVHAIRISSVILIVMFLRLGRTMSLIKTSGKTFEFTISSLSKGINIVSVIGVLILLVISYFTVDLNMKALDYAIAILYNGLIVLGILLSNSKKTIAFIILICVDTLAAAWTHSEALSVFLNPYSVTELADMALLPVLALIVFIVFGVISLLNISNNTKFSEMDNKLLNDIGPLFYIMYMLFNTSNKKDKKDQ